MNAISEKLKPHFDPESKQVYVGRTRVVTLDGAINLLKEKNLLELRADETGHFKILDKETLKTIAYINHVTYYLIESSLTRLHHKTLFSRYWQWAHEQTHKSQVYLNWLLHWKFKEDDWFEHYATH